MKVSNGNGGVLAITRAVNDAARDERNKADRRFAAWERNHGWPKISDQDDAYWHHYEPEHFPSKVVS